ncbi:uncharacterized protein LOC134228028 [Armigeres subalbatus]|uniref:uncharacterized protein LOC134228028 n=1 Tax=Armigeres subalbatus TaxID=124917 RepID=UPI002ECFF257
MPEETLPLLIDDLRETPGWINENYFESLLRKCKDDASIKVQSVQVKYALPKGENYASVIYRAQVIFSRKDQLPKTCSYIIKGISETPLAKQKLSEYDVHRKEMDVYQLVIPEFRQLMKSVGDHAELYPNPLYVDRKNDVMILNDVTQQGYVMVNRIQGLDAAHAKMSLRAMAKLHATSVKLLEIYPKIYERYTTGMFTRETDAFHIFFQSTYDALTDEIYTWEPEWHYYADKMRNLRPHFIEQALCVFDNECEEDLRVFVHSDLWTNNLMFKYDAKGQPIDVLILDFQYCCYATPAIDLFYFFFTSTRDEIRQNCFDEYMHYYYCHLTKYSKRLNCTKRFPTLHQFQQQLLKKMFYAIYSTAVALPVHLNNEQDADFDALMAGDERSRRFKKAIMTNKKYHKIIKGLLPMFDRKGLLDRLE